MDTALGIVFSLINSSQRVAAQQGGIRTGTGSPSPDSIGEFLLRKGDTVRGAFAFAPVIINLTSSEIIDIGIDTDDFTSRLIIANSGGFDIKAIDGGGLNGAAQFNGQLLVTQGVVTESILFKNNPGSGDLTTGNFETLDGGDFLVEDDDLILWQFDSTDNKWQQMTLGKAWSRIDAVSNLDMKGFNIVNIGQAQFGDPNAIIDLIGVDMFHDAPNTGSHIFAINNVQFFIVKTTATHFQKVGIPKIHMENLTPTPIDNVIAAQYEAHGETDAGTKVNYGDIQFTMADTAEGTAGAGAIGQINLRTTIAGNINLFSMWSLGGIADTLRPKRDIDMANANDLLNVRNIEMVSGFNNAKLFFDDGVDTYFTGSGSSGRINVFNDAVNRYAFQTNGFVLFANSVLIIDERTDAEGPPALIAGFAQLFAKQDASDSNIAKLGYVQDDGTEIFPLGTGGGGFPVLDTVFEVQDNVDTTKRHVWALENQTTGTTITFSSLQTVSRTHTFPNATGVLATLAAIAQTFQGDVSFNEDVNLGLTSVDLINFRGRIRNGTDIIPAVDLGSNLGDTTHAFSIGYINKLVLDITTKSIDSVGSLNVEHKVPSGGDIIFLEDITQFWRLDGGENQAIFSRDIALTSAESVRADGTSEIGFWVTNTTSSVGLFGTMQMPVDTGSAGSAANADTDFGNKVGCFGLYLSSGGVPVLVIKMDESPNTWAILILNAAGNVSAGRLT